METEILNKLKSASLVEGKSIKTRVPPTIIKFYSNDYIKKALNGIFDNKLNSSIIVKILLENDFSRTNLLTSLLKILSKISDENEEVIKFIVDNEKELLNFRENFLKKYEELVEKSDISKQTKLFLKSNINLFTFYDIVNEVTKKHDCDSFCKNTIFLTYKLLNFILYKNLLSVIFYTNVSFYGKEDAIRDIEKILQTINQISISLSNNIKSLDDTNTQTYIKTEDIRKKNLQLIKTLSSKENNLEETQQLNEELIKQKQKISKKQFRNFLMYLISMIVIIGYSIINTTLAFNNRFVTVFIISILYILVFTISKLIT